MNLATIAARLDAETARVFVRAARHVIDAMLIEAERVRQTQTPQERDYGAAQLDRSTPAGGWISHDELRSTAQRLAEAMSAEKWIDGFLLAMQLLLLLRP
jgi:predicted phage gp36 major capsid-like protein